MNRFGPRLTMLAVALAGAIAALVLVQQYMLGQSPHDSPPSDLTQASSTHTSDRLNILDGSSSDSELTESALDPGIPNDGDVVGEWGDFVRFRDVATNCRHETKTLIRDEETDVRAVWQCDTKTVADHAYQNLSDAQLKQIANQDGVAALILGVRLSTSAPDVESYKAATGYLYSAVLLTGERQAYQTLMAHQDIAFGATYVNDNVDSIANANSYVWTVAGEHLGILSESDISAIRRAVATDEQLDVDTLNAMAMDLAQQFKDRRVALVGETFN